MTIVAAVDGDARTDEVVTVGKDLADAYDTELLVLHVMSEGEFERRRENREYFADDASRDAGKTAAWVVSGTLDDGGNVRSEGAVGEPVAQIVEYAERNDADYIVVGGKKRSPAGKAVFGSVTQSVLMRADRPVVTVMGE